MEPSDDDRNAPHVTWHSQVSVAQGKQRAFRSRLRLPGTLLVVTVVAFAAGFTVRSLFNLQPRGVNSNASTNSPSMIARTAGTLSTTSHSNAVSADSIVIDVHGDVVHPGVYHLTLTARLQDAVQAAGGFKHAKDADSVNLAAPLSDGQEVLIQDVTANTKTDPQNTSKSGGAITEHVVTNSIAKSSSTSVPGQGSLGPINLNTADAATLETLPGIGPGRAAAIVHFRDEHGPFAKVSDIQQVSGIGAGIFQRIQAYLVTGP